jgi:uncharacterized integral membrane protein
MINEQRVKLMTRMAIYEKNSGAEDERTNSYFLNDYISGQFLRSFVCVTISFIIIAGVYGIYNFEELMLTVYSLDLKALAIRIIAAYAVFLAGYLIITFLVYSVRYMKMRKRLEQYYRDLRKLAASYREEGDR